MHFFETQLVEQSLDYLLFGEKLLDGKMHDEIFFGGPFGCFVFGSRIGELRLLSELSWGEANRHPHGGSDDVSFWGARSGAEHLPAHHAGHVAAFRRGYGGRRGAGERAGDPGGGKKERVCPRGPAPF